MLSSTTVFAADNMAVKIDNTKTIADGGSLPDGITYNVTVPTSMTLKATDQNVTSIDENTAFSGSANISFTGSLAAAGNALTISVSSKDANDSGNKITLKIDETKKTQNGTFQIGSVDNATEYALTEADINTMLTTGLNIPVSVKGVTNANQYGVYEGGLVFNITTGN